MRLRVFCPAKINPFLSVGPRDETGYHPIKTRFQAIGIFDELIIEDKANQFEIVSDWTDLPVENTIGKAYRFLAEVCDLPPLRIELRKRIPPESGLGGGSSDAAGLLRAVNRLAKAAPSEREIVEVARAVGKDVPFFLVGGTALGERYGDAITPLEDEPEQWLVVAKPDVRCNTKEAYEKLDKTARAMRTFPQSELHNEFETVAPSECLVLKKRLLNLGASAALLCGSGSAVFGKCEDSKTALEVATKLSKEGVPFAQVARTLSRDESLRIESG